MQASPQRPPAPLGVLFDSSLDGGIDQVLALAMLFGFAATQRVRVPSASTSRYNLQNAAFLDLVARFFTADLAGDFVPNKIPLPIGMYSSGKQTDMVPPMVSAVLAKVGADGSPVYPRGIAKLNDTADPIALMRNALTAYTDQNAAVVLAGLPANLLSLLALPGGKDWAGEEGARAEHCRRTIRRGCGRSGHPGGCGRLQEAAGRMAYAHRDGGRRAERGAAVSGRQPRRHRGMGAESSGGRCISRVQADAVRAPSQALAAVLYTVSTGRQLLHVV